MEYRRLGTSGLKVSLIGLGANQFGGKVETQTVQEIFHAALDLGINLIDTADVYQQGRSEETIGLALLGKRQQAVLATKVFNPMGTGPNDHSASRKHILDGVEASLKRLKTDYIDLYQIHRWDDETPIEETMQTLHHLVVSGKVRYIGASNFAAWQLIHANSVAEINGWTRFVAIQPHYHMFERSIESELIPACQYFGLGILPYFPLAGGFLTGKYQRGAPAPAGSRGESSAYVQRYMTDENYDRLNRLQAYAVERGHTINELAHAWLLAQPQISSVISGVTRLEQVLHNAASAAWVLSTEEVAGVNNLLK